MAVCLSERQPLHRPGSHLSGQQASLTHPLQPWLRGLVTDELLPLAENNPWVGRRGSLCVGEVLTFFLAGYTKCQPRSQDLAWAVEKNNTSSRVGGR